MKLGLRAPHELVPSVDAVERLLSYGCEVLEVTPEFFEHSGYPPAEAEAVLVHHLRHAEIELISWWTDTQLVTAPDEVAAVLDRLEGVIEHAARVQTKLQQQTPPTVVARSGSAAELAAMEPRDLWRQAVRIGRRAASKAASLGVRFAVVPKRADVIDSASQARRLLDEVECPAMGICLDPAYIYWRDEDLDEMVKVLGQDTFVARLKDVVLVRDGMWLKGYRPFGQGMMDTAKCLRLLASCSRCAGAILDCVEHSLAVRETVALVQRGGEKKDERPSADALASDADERKQGDCDAAPAANATGLSHPGVAASDDAGGVLINPMSPPRAARLTQTEFEAMLRESTAARVH